MSFLKDLLKSVISSEVKKEVKKQTSSLTNQILNQKPNAQTAYQQPVYQQPSWQEPAPSGESWGPYMPNEPNQFNSGMTYTDYFRSVFAEAFPEYRIDCERPHGCDAAIFTFWQGEWKAMIVELLPQSSGAYKLRRDCQRSGLPYLRFYHNHEGWWNTKSYVIKRVSAALRR